MGCFDGAFGVIDRRTGAPRPDSWAFIWEQGALLAALWLSLAVIGAGAVGLAVIAVAITVWVHHPCRREVPVTRGGCDLLVLWVPLLGLVCAVSLLPS